MFDPVEEHLDVVPADEDYGAEEGQSGDCDRDVAYGVGIDATDRRRSLGGAHPILDVVYVDDLIHDSIDLSNIFGNPSASCHPSIVTCSWRNHKR